MTRRPVIQSIFSLGGSLAMVKGLKRVLRKYDLPENWLTPTQGNSTQENINKTNELISILQEVSNAMHSRDDISFSKQLEEAGDGITWKKVGLFVLKESINMDTKIAAGIIFTILFLPLLSALLSNSIGKKLRKKKNDNVDFATQTEQSHHYGPAERALLQFGKSKSEPILLEDNDIHPILSNLAGEKIEEGNQSEEEEKGITGGKEDEGKDEEQQEEGDDYGQGESEENVEIISPEVDDDLNEEGNHIQVEDDENTNSFENVTSFSNNIEDINSFLRPIEEEEGNVNDNKNKADNEQNEVEADQVEGAQTSIKEDNNGEDRNETDTTYDMAIRTIDFGETPSPNSLTHDVENETSTTNNSSYKLSHPNNADVALIHLEPDTTALERNTLTFPEEIPDLNEAEALVGGEEKSKDLRVSSNGSLSSHSNSPHIHVSPTKSMHPDAQVNKEQAYSQPFTY
ncbi:Nvj1p NDAI_0D03320 [Naumovozyma dairenensis CBS 421]|uniref:Uncharacterized protein n=1 Tax=Naumovozyma dairenensis (strain ATCC 10597 / BCRC 20456 / CBS 421 / NBRC 0211 / NRRL Y-12639) TaxID=1071378 RepID=G0WA35_NAUDC|nr:hypothetical protein NDAI_0D03320 [Naumovozyma dairenensis CBS 421]CCD24646.1 hypothetical protein NDAI_0D03320 [Naumovozyma dairenensis CBS 421]